MHWERALLPGHRSERLNAVQAYVEDNLEWGDLTPAAIARAFGISVRQLHLLFEPTGTTFSRYVLSRRLDRARRVLSLDPTRKILDVALECGIESSTVFYRGFRDAFGMNPTDYRRSLHNAGSSQWARAGADASVPQPI
jgi:transcriptional regulator GlxA family with amidase domain